MTQKRKNLTLLPSGIWQVEWHLPPDISALLGKRSLRKSTGTRDPAQAEIIRDAAMVEWREMIERLRRPDFGDVRHSLDLKKAEDRQEWEQFVKGDGPISVNEDTYKKILVDRERREREKERLQRTIDTIDRVLRRAEIEPPKPATVTAAPSVIQFPDSIPISQALKRWATEQPKSKKTASAYDVMLRRFIAANGDILVAATTRAHVRKFREQTEQEVGSEGTVINMLSKLNALLTWAADNGFRPTENVTSGIGPTSQVAKAKKKLPFSADEINRIHQYVVKTYRTSEDRYWLFTAALMSGLRAEELCALRPCDVRQVDGVWCFDINRDDGKYVKNEPSVRLVPLHNKLVELGFLNHLSASRQKSRLFSSLKPDTNNRYSTYWLNHINHVLHKHLNFGPDHSFHGSRHSFKDAVRDAKIEKQVADRLEGRGEKGSGKVYGRGHSAPALNEELQKISYPGVDWSIFVDE